MVQLYDCERNIKIYLCRCTLSELDDVEFLYFGNQGERVSL